jgi:type I restriction enzyme S subunit
MMDAPSNWREYRLGDLGEVFGGGTPSTSVARFWGGDIPWLVPGEVSKLNGFHISKTARTITEDGLQNSVANLLPPGTVMMTSRATIGEVAINVRPMATNQGFINLVCKRELVDSEFLAFWIAHNKPIFIDRAHGVTFKEITKANFKSIPVALPPLSEQRAIAHALQSVQKAKDVREHELALERERRAVLMHHFFTHGTRGQASRRTEIGDIPETWGIAEVSQLCTRITDGTHDTPKPSPEGELLVTAVHIKRGSLDLTGAYRISREDFDGINARSQVDQFDVLMTMIGVNTGEVAFVAEPPRFAIKNVGLFKTGGNKELGLWLSYFFQSRQFQRFLRNRVSGTSQPYAPLWLLRSIPTPIPSAEERRDIVSVLHSSDSKIATLRREIALFTELFAALRYTLMEARVSVDSLTEGISND